VVSPGLVDVKKKSGQSLPFCQTNVHGKSVDDWVELEMDAQSQENTTEKKYSFAKKMERHLERCSKGKYTENVYNNNKKKNRSSILQL